jgi:hypothetical protein
VAPGPAIKLICDLRRPRTARQCSRSRCLGLAATAARGVCCAVPRRIAGPGIISCPSFVQGWRTITPSRQMIDNASNIGAP